MCMIVTIINGLKIIQILCYSQIIIYFDCIDRNKYLSNTYRIQMLITYANCTNMAHINHSVESSHSSADGHSAKSLIMWI